VIPRPIPTVSAAVLLILGAFGAAAQGLPATPDGSPVEVTSDNAIEWHQNDRAYVARGHARAVRGDSTVEADILTAYYRETPGKGTEVVQLVADGNVRILGPSRQVTGTRAIYDTEKRILVVSGSNLRLVTPTDVVTARDSLEYYELDNQAVARGDALAVRNGKDRMRADVLIGQFTKGADGGSQLTRLDGSGSVVVTNATDVATGDKLVYSVPEDVAVLIGNVKITRNDNQLDGEAAEMNMKTKVNRVIAGKDAGGRVKALLIPGSNSSVLPGTAAR
jgi:lipopolysaccharide export system protein LptA